MDEYRLESENLLGFLKECPTAFHSVAAIKKRLDAAGFTQLYEEDRWTVAQGDRRYVIRNGSAIIAFKADAAGGDYCFKLGAAHGDYPCFKLKELPSLKDGAYIRLNVEGYGGMICSTWLDRPLSIAGRVVVKEGRRFMEKLVDIDRDLLLIPNLPIHMNREVNDGFAYNKQIDLLPLWSSAEGKQPDVKQLIAAELGVKPEDIAGTDLYLYPRTQPSVWGASGEFISSAHLDDMQCGYALLQGFINEKGSGDINVFACFDNEEVGSETRQGAASDFLYDVLHRVNSALGFSEEDYSRAVAGGFCVSADNAHALHPNHPEKYDAANRVFMNGGIVIKANASQKYASDAVSSAMFKAVCEKSGVPVQFFANRSDMPGGSTLGNISSSRVPFKTVDIGLAQLAMHSAYETAGVKDTLWLEKAMECFWTAQIKSGPEGFSVE